MVPRKRFVSSPQGLLVPLLSNSFSLIAIRGESGKGRDSLRASQGEEER